MAQDLSLNVSANTTSAQASMGQLATITEAQMKRIASFVKAATDEQAKMARVVKDSANSSSYQAMADGANKVASAHAGVNRELLVLGHEISQGNFSRFGGSLLVLAERTNALHFAMTGVGAATLGVGAALVGSLALIAKGAIDADKLAKSMQLTGNYAAVTSENLAHLSLSQSAKTGQTPGATRGSLEAVAGSGLVQCRPGCDRGARDGRLSATHRRDRRRCAQKLPVHPGRRRSLGSGAKQVRPLPDVGRIRAH